MTVRAGLLGALFTIAAAISGIHAVPASAQDLSLEQQTVLARANSALNDLQQVSGKFIQVGPDGSRAEGRIFLQRPGKMRFEYDPPSELQIISDGFWVAIQDRKLKTTEKYPLATTPLKLILASDVDLARDAYVRDVNTQEGFVTLTLQERAGEADGSLILIFDSETFRSAPVDRDRRAGSGYLHRAERNGRRRTFPGNHIPHQRDRHA